MTEQTRQVLRAALTHLKFQADQVAQAIAAVTLVLGETAETHQPPRRAPRATRKAATAAPAPRTKTSRAKKADAGYVQALALKALAGGPGTTRELATRVKLNGEAGYQSMWWALKSLTASGMVTKRGTTYHLARNGSGAADTAVD